MFRRARLSGAWRGDSRRRRIGAGLLIVVLGALAAALSLAETGSPAHARPRRHRASPLVEKPVGRRAGTALLLAATDALGVRHIKQLIVLGRPIYCGGSHGHDLAFTFDDGPGPYTGLALRKLTGAGERATFFVVGRSMKHFPGWVARETAVATIGDHTYQHPVLPELSPAQIKFQLSETKRAIERATGQPVHLFRPPYGAHDATVDAIARRLGLLEVLWSVDSADSLGANWARIIRNVEGGMRPGAIILMHENRGQTIRALTTLLPTLRRRHLRSVSLTELLASDPPSAAQVREGAAGCGAGAPLVRSG